MQHITEKHEPTLLQTTKESRCGVLKPYRFLPMGGICAVRFLRVILDVMRSYEHMFSTVLVRTDSYLNNLKTIVNP